MTKYLPVIAILFAVIALGLFAYVTDAVAFAGSNPETCANCHVMDDVYENWFHAPHKNVTKCVDCHLPHDNVVAYYVEKGRTGMHDVYMFSTGQTPEVIRATEHTKGIIQDNCVRCHQSTVDVVVMSPHGSDRYCWECHRNVSHGARGLSLLPLQDSELYPIHK